MAYSIKIEVFSEPGSASNMKADMDMEPDWWKISELLDTWPFQQMKSNPFREFVLYVSKTELQEIHLAQLAHTEAGKLYGNAAWQRIIAPKIQQLSEFLSKSGEDQTIRLSISEW